jgi:hypothetical protein
MNYENLAGGTFTCVPAAYLGEFSRTGLRQLARSMLMRFDYRERLVRRSYGE